MHSSTTGLVLSPTDLAAFSECAHRTVLDLAVVTGELAKPGQNEVQRRLLEQRGLEHEARVLEYYRELGRTVVGITAAPGSAGAEEAARQTLLAMHAGAEVIYQGVLLDGSWHGRPDFLVKTEGKTRFGSFGYEAVDAKLSRAVKARAVLQLCVYTEQLHRLQDCWPRHFWIATGHDQIAPLALPTADYIAYYRAVSRRFQTFLQDSERNRPYPDPVEHCEICHWWKGCERKRREDDHLSLVAGISRRQQDRLELAGVSRLAQLAALPPTAKLEGIADTSLRRVREQARLQLESRIAGTRHYELLLEIEPGTGFERLPSPTPGDLFLDLEGDPFVRGNGLEYLFGLVELGEVSDDFLPREAGGEPRYHAFWATNPAEEKRAFEAVVDRIQRGLGEFPRLHVYHFGHRENDALKKLSCVHRSREGEVDRILRAGVLVDLHTVTRQSVRVGVEGYTLKQLEVLYGYQRQVELRAAAQAMQYFGFWLETQDTTAVEPELRDLIARYNEDDCLSTWKLRAWLEARRLEFREKTGRLPPRPPDKEGKASETRQHESEQTAALAARLVQGLAEDTKGEGPEPRARRLLAHLLDWPWREAKSAWWEYYRAKELSAADRLEDRAALGGLRFVEELPPAKRSRLYRYEFPEQEHAIQKLGAEDPDTGKSAGTIVELGPAQLVLSRGKNSQVPHPSALIPAGPPDTTAHRQRLLELGQRIADHGFDSSELRVAAELLLRHPPRCGQQPGSPLLKAGEDTVVGIQRLALALDHSVLAVQGPPGSGKTYRAAEMIVALVAAGHRVGVTANSHQVIVSLLAKAEEAAGRRGIRLRALHIGDPAQFEQQKLTFEITNDYQKVEARLRASELDLVGGTTWAWSRDSFSGMIDYLVVDEAGQVSLANVLAVAHAAQSLVLFGDPAQLDQPQKGAHPPGAEVSAFEHILGDDLTLQADRGVFLPETRRLHPAVCAFTSEVFYEGRLEPTPGLSHQRIDGPAPFNGSGLRFVPVKHRGNSNRADEEVETIARLLETLLAANPRWTDSKLNIRQLTAADTLVIAPYNAQVAALRRKLPTGVSVGTVDKFQGQQAPVVIYSMTSSSAEDAPRGMEFLYNLNRLNVATSRAQALVLLVASPELILARCKTPKQMRLANGLCRYLELARTD